MPEMRFLLDMNLPVTMAEWLRAEGHDAAHLREVGLERLPDDEVMRRAVAENRIPITCDLDFGDILGSSSDAVSSVVLLRLRSLRQMRVRPRLRVALSQCAEVLATGAIVLVEDARIRVRSLPFS